MAISESWIKDISEQYANLQGYNCEHTIRNGDEMGGGVSLYIKEGIDYVKRDDLSISLPDYETVFIEIDKKVSLTSKNMIIRLSQV